MADIYTLYIMKTYFLLLVLSISVFANAGEIERIQSHLKLVETLLRLQDTSHLDNNQLHNRKSSLDVLNNYWQRGEFPQNISRPNSRHPFFIDHRGVPCAVGYLIIQSGYPELAQRISMSQNELFLEQMQDPELGTWIERSGFTSEELRLIQPGYGYTARSSDPILEAAYLFDLEKFKTLVTAAGLKQGSPEYLEKMSAALRLVAPSAGWNHSQKDDYREFSMYSPPPIEGRDGKEILNYLIQQKADPNYSSDTQPSVLYLTKVAEVRKILKVAGARLTNPELLLEAIEGQDLKQVKKLLDQPNYKPYGSQINLPTPLMSAIHSIRSDTNTTTELSKNPRPEYKIVYLLMTHPSKKIDLHEITNNETTIFSYVLSNNIRTVAAEYFAQNIKVESANEADSLLSYYLATKKAGHKARTPAKLQNKIKMDLIQAKSKLKTSQTLSSYFFRSIEESDVETAKFLIELGVDPKSNPEIFRGYFYNLKSVQLTNIQRKIIRILIEMGFEVNTTFNLANYGKVSPLNYFIMNAEYDLIQFALDSGASATYDLDDMCSPLATAVAKNDLKAASLLLKNNADPQALSVADGCYEVAFPRRYLTKIKIIDMPMSSAMKKLLSKK